MTINNETRIAIETKLGIIYGIFRFTFTRI